MLCDCAEHSMLLKFCEGFVDLNKVFHRNSDMHIFYCGCSVPRMCAHPGTGTSDGYQQCYFLAGIEEPFVFEQSSAHFQCAKPNLVGRHYRVGSRQPSCPAQGSTGATDVIRYFQATLYDAVAFKCSLILSPEEQHCPSIMLRFFPLKAQFPLSTWSFFYITFSPISLWQLQCLIRKEAFMWLCKLVRIGRVSVIFMLGEYCQVFKSVLATYFHGVKVVK